MGDNNTSKRVTDVPFVQWDMNTTFHEAIMLSPYKAVHGKKPCVGLLAYVSRNFLGKLTPGILEENVETMLIATLVDMQPVLYTDGTLTPTSNNVR